MRNTLRALLGAVALTGWATLAHAEGNLAAQPPVDLTVNITGGDAGPPRLSATDFDLVTGKYYRLVFKSTPGWRIEAPDLLQNVHLRVLAVGDVLVHLQGMAFRAIDLSEAGGEASFSFVPIRPGTYYVLVQNAASPIGQPGAGNTAPARQGAVKLTVK